MFKEQICSIQTSQHVPQLSPDPKITPPTFHKITQAGQYLKFVFTDTRRTYLLNNNA